MQPWPSSILIERTKSLHLNINWPIVSRMQAVMSQRLQRKALNLADVPYKSRDPDDTHNP